MNRVDELVNNLNAKLKDDRLNSLKELMKLINNGEIEKPVATNNVNSHIHTTYSFSPYSPTMAVWKAYQAGLITAGIMDHDSISGAREFIEAGKIVGLATTIGFECRTMCTNTKIEGLRINNPDQVSVAYITVHGIPHTMIDEADSFIAPYRDKRNVRNKKMVKILADMFSCYGVDFSFENDVVPISLSDEGGSITERHVLFGLITKILEKYRKGQELVSFLTDKIGINLNEKAKLQLLDLENPYYNYDLLGIMKSELVGKFYIDAFDECPHITEIVSFAKRIGAISSYAYLGDVGNSVTGDKKTQKFEDDYLDMLFDFLSDLNFNAVSYMPSRNTLIQLERVRKLCAQKGFFEISGEDINSPRQVFVCDALNRPEFSHLIYATWALIGHEKEATKDITKGMFSNETIKAMPNINDRIDYFNRISKN